MHHIDDQGGWEDHPVLHPLFEPQKNAKKKIGSVQLGIATSNASTIWRYVNTAKMNQFIAAVITRAQGGYLMVGHTRYVSLRESQKWFRDSKTTANKGWESQYLQMS